MTLSEAVQQFSHQLLATVRRWHEHDPNVLWYYQTGLAAGVVVLSTLLLFPGKSVSPTKSNPTQTERERE